jgi:hypothetical protein
VRVRERSRENELKKKRLKIFLKKINNGIDDLLEFVLSHLSTSTLY